MNVRDYTAFEVLKDGTRVIVRAIRSDDANSVLAEFKHLDPTAIYTRFFSYKKELTDADLEQITHVDFGRVVALVVTTRPEEGGRLIGGGRYVCDLGRRNAELAFLTGENYRGQGIAALILKHLVRIGLSQGLSRFEADVLAENAAMLAVLRRSGLLMKEQRQANVIHFTIALSEQGAP